MSDHEGVAPEDWNKPLASKQARQKSSHRESSIPDRSDDLQFKAKPYTRNDSATQRTLGISRRSEGARSTQSISSVQGSINNLASENFRKGDKYEGHYELSMRWTGFLKNIQDEENPDQIARDHLDDICRGTDTYIPTPEVDATKILIWGTPKQVEKAKLALDCFERDVLKRTTKSNDLDGVEEAKMKLLGDDPVRTVETVTSLNEFVGELDFDFDFEAYILWPRSIEMEAFIREHDKIFIDEIRHRYQCSIEYKSIPVQCLKICTLSKSALMQVYTRILNLVKEIIAREKGSSRLNIAQLPSAAKYRDLVDFVQDLRLKVAFPILRGAALRGSKEDYEADRLTTTLRNEVKIRSSIEACLKYLQLPQTHPKLRVIFGEMAFSQYRQPGPGKTTHSIETFGNMIQHSRVRMHLRGLKIIDEDISQLVNMLSKIEILGKPTTSHKVHFEFQGTLSNSALRLEADIKPSRCNKSFDISDKQWYDIDDEKDTVLEVNIINLDEPSVQIRLDASRPHNNETLNEHMSSFPKNIKFNAPSKEFGFCSKRKTVIPPGYKELKMVSEISALRFSFKTTDAVLELQRKDVFDESLGRNSEKPSDTIYSVHFYYPNWDYLLQQWACLKSGEEPALKISVQTLFLGDGNAIPRDFQTFMKDLNEIKELLQNSIETLPNKDTPHLD